jgi:hypothetical protein
MLPAKASSIGYRDLVGLTGLSALGGEASRERNMKHIMCRMVERHDTPGGVGFLHDIAGTSLVLPPWEAPQLVKRTAHFDAHLRVLSKMRDRNRSGTGAYSNFLNEHSPAAPAFQWYCA